MEGTYTVSMTALDEAVSDSGLQMIKAAIPYVQLSEQKFIAILAKFMELQNTIAFFEKEPDDLSACSFDKGSAEPLDMLNDIKAYGNEKQQESIDMIINMLNAMEMYKMYSETMKSAEQSGEDGEGEGPDMFSMLKTMLPPEQQSMFDTYSMMLGNM